MLEVPQTKLTQIHEQFAVELTDRQTDDKDEDTAPAKRARTKETAVPTVPATSCLAERNS